MTEQASPKDAVAAIIERILPEIIETRHHLHQNPELSGAEEATGAYVADRLWAWNFDEVQTGVAGHGVVGILHGQKDGPMLALRADMDALPIQETSELEYASCKSGIMHACGHDGHTATLLGTALVLSELREHLPGPVKFLFQPAEETIGGADAMITAGALEGVKSIVALHGWPNIEIGQIGYRPGPMMASADMFNLTVKGKGGHAAYPHTTVDPIMIGSQIVTAWQTIASREVSPLDSVVLTVTQFHAGNAYNVIPGVAELKGTVRTLSNAVRDEIPAKMERITAGICAAFRADYEFSYELGPPVVVNDPALTSLVEAVGHDILGPDGVTFLETPTMGAEDFAYYLLQVPGVMFRLGVGTDVTALHTPTYNFSDGALPYGIGMLANIAPAVRGMTQFSGVLFDLDDTLYSRRAAFGSWLDTYLRDTLRLTDTAEIERVRDLIAALDQNGYGSKQAIFERLHTLYPTLPGEASRSLGTFFIEFLTYVKPETETETLLDALAAAGIPFGVITNGSARQWRKIDALGLDKRTSCLFVSETFGVKKPNTAIFQAAADCLGHLPSDILFVGDNPTADILGAHAAGMPAAWLHRGQTWPEELEDKPDFTIDSLGKLVDILGIDST